MLSVQKQSSPSKAGGSSEASVFPEASAGWMVQSVRFNLQDSVQILPHQLENLKWSLCCPKPVQNLDMTTLNLWHNSKAAKQRDTIDASISRKHSPLKFVPASGNQSFSANLLISAVSAGQYSRYLYKSVEICGYHVIFLNSENPYMSINFLTLTPHGQGTYQGFTTDCFDSGSICGDSQNALGPTWDVGRQSSWNIMNETSENISWISFHISVVPLPKKTGCPTRKSTSIQVCPASKGLQNIHNMFTSTKCEARGMK